jgi:putative sterol carrier protein
MADAESLMDEMRKRADALRRLGYSVRFDLTDTGESVLLDATTGGAPGIEPATGDEEADTVLRMSSTDLDKLMRGKLSPMLAFSTGRLRVEGSKGVAMKLGSLLDED